ncbi:MAG: DNA-3-methyladenine glycosylase 2 family protein [Myxococcota bacterium]
MTEARTARWRPPFRLHLERTLGGLSRGAYDPSAFFDRDGSFWRATRTPEGPATTRYRHDGEEILGESWGPGAAWSLAQMPELLGARDDLEGFEPSGKLKELHRRLYGLRMPRTRAIYEALLRSVLEQKVTGKEAQRGYRGILRTFGERAPGPQELYVPPTPERLAGVPYYDLHPLGVEMRRAETLRRVATVGAELEALADQPLEAARARLLAIPGIGEWTVAEVSLLALGDADAVSVGDYHLKNTVTYAFTGRARGTDEEMLELLEPYRPHRGRVIRLIEAAGIHAPKFGARQKLRRF